MNTSLNDIADLLGIQPTSLHAPDCSGRKIMKHTLSAVALAVAVMAPPLIVGAPALATPATHDVLVEDYDAADPLPAGEMPCVPWAGTFHEVRSGQYTLVTINNGPQKDEVHVNGVIAGLIELVPDDKTLPTYSGTYREKTNAVLYGQPFEDDQLRVAQYRLRSRLQGTDGTSLELALSGKVTRTAEGGPPVVERSTFTCE